MYIHTPIVGNLYAITLGGIFFIPAVSGIGAFFELPHSYAIHIVIKVIRTSES